MREQGYTVASCDVTVILERPKLAPHVEAIRAAMAAVLGVAADRVSVKGKTNEGVDAVGRGEAIASHAVAVLAPVLDPFDRPLQQQARRRERHLFRVHHELGAEAAADIRRHHAQLVLVEPEQHHQERAHFVGELG